MKRLDTDRQAAIGALRGERAALIPALTIAAQDPAGLSDEILKEVSELLDVPLIKLKEAALFYPKWNGELTEEMTDVPADHAHVNRETRVLLCGDIPDFGRTAALARDPEKILEELASSGLCGRGGANFPVAAKWRSAKDTPAKERFIICNIAEGEPGTGKDRALLGACPKKIVEGVILCAAATGAEEGFIYLRPGYEEAAQGLKGALKEAEEAGCLGENFCGTGRKFTLKLFEGAGGYTCGEETGLIETIEGNRAEPRLKPPYPGNAGLWGEPTVINNAETFADVSAVIRDGAAAFTRYGTEKSSGTKLFTVTGCVADPGVYEVPMGTTIADLYDIAGGCPVGKQLKGLICGGRASGSFAGTDRMQVKLDPAHCQEAGLSLGTGSLYFIRAGESVPALCRDAVRFFARESCGKCSPCRYGMKHLAGLLGEVADHAAKEGSVAEILALADYISMNSACGLGQAVSGPVGSAVRAFPDEFYAGEVK